jgi:O-antigen ligase
MELQKANSSLNNERSPIYATALFYIRTHPIFIIWPEVIIG